MSGDFEKNISQRMNGFRLPPGPQVWERVATALPEKRRRRIAIWWLLPLAACLGGGVWMAFDKQQNTDKKRSIDIAQEAPVAYSTQKKSIQPVRDDTTSTYALSPQQKTPISKEQIPTQQKVDVTKTEITDISKKEVVINYQYDKSWPVLEPTHTKAHRKTAATTTDNDFPEMKSETYNKQTEGIIYQLNPATGSLRLQMPISSDSFFLNMQSVLPAIYLAAIPKPDLVAKNDTALPKMRNTQVETAAGIKIPEAKNKMPQWNLVVAVGKSSLANNTGASQKLFADANYLNSGGLTSGGQGRMVGAFNNPTAGFHFSAGIIRNQMISKHFSWQAGVSYQLLTTKQHVGSRNDSLEKADVFTDAAFYTVGRTGNASGTVRSNSVHRLQMASDIRYTLNPAANTPVSFSAGASLAYNISNNLLLHDYRSYSYIRSAKLSNQLMLGGQAGMDIFISHKIHAGLFYQHDFTNVAKPEARSDFRWNQVQLRIGIPLSKQK